MKTRTELHGIIEQLDAAMLRAANEVSDDVNHWEAWNFATASLPKIDEVPSDLGYWWQNQLLDASRRAFGSKHLRRRYHQGDFQAADIRYDGVVWNSGPCGYGGREVRIELRRQTLGAAWSAVVTVSNLHEFKIIHRMFLAGIPATFSGAIGAYALALEEARREIDRLNRSPA